MQRLLTGDALMTGLDLLRRNQTYVGRVTLTKDVRLQTADVARTSCPKQAMNLCWLNHLPRRSLGQHHRA